MYDVRRIPEGLPNDLDQRREVRRREVVSPLCKAAPGAATLAQFETQKSQTRKRHENILNVIFSTILGK